MAPCGVTSQQTDYLYNLACIKQRDSSMALPYLRLFILLMN